MVAGIAAGRAEGTGQAGEQRAERVGRTKRTGSRRIWESRESLDYLDNWERKNRGKRRYIM